MKKAGDVKGIPEWQQNQIYEIDAPEKSKEVEELERKAKQALGDSLDFGVKELRKCISTVTNGSLCADYKMADRLTMLLNELEDSLSILKEIREECRG
jgi:hypothetical protein